AKSPFHRNAIEGLLTIETHVGSSLDDKPLHAMSAGFILVWARNANCLLEPSPKSRMFYWQCKASSSLDEKTSKIKPFVNQSMRSSEHHTPSRCSYRLHKVGQVIVHR
ncbi:hypothetical protein TNIN_64281, partial [Trichonephila inaurata madagascariensis]